MTDPLRARLAPVLCASPALFDYQRWLAQQPARSERDYLFEHERPRFEPRREDVVVPLPGLVPRARGKTALLCCVSPHLELPLDRLAAADVERMLAAMDGQRCLLEVRWHSGATPEQLARLLRAGFGTALYAPAAVGALEHRLAGVEVTRFPSSPYAIERSYWENMIALRERFEARLDDLADTDSFTLLLRELHVLAVMGPDLDRFYRPASPGAERQVAPGAFLAAPVRAMERNDVTVMLSGPRVRAAMVGGEAYLAALCGSLGVPLRERARFEEDGLPWGELLHGRGENDDAPGPWFCPPRPLETAHFEWLRRELGKALAAAERGATELAVRAAARFHRAFVTLHPFHCANQSLAMSCVNAVLRRLGGVGIPHLTLDHLALRLPSAAYAEVFRRAVAAWSVVDEPPRRLAILLERRLRATQLLEGLARGESADVDPEAARAALLLP